MRNRQAIAACGVLALIGGTLLVRAPLLDVVTPFTACLGLAVLLACWPATRTWLPWATLAAGVLSIAVTAVSVATVPRTANGESGAQGAWILLEPAALLVYVYLTLRWAPPRLALATGGTAVLATALEVQRFLPPDTLWSTVAASVLWILPGVASGAVAWYLRHLVVERDRAIVAARREQRLDLASDLHDFVAHDVSEIVAQAQAARMVLAGDDPRIAEVLGRIEGAGLRALASMDRTVHMLRDTGAAARTPVGVLADLPELAARFSTGGIEVRLDLTDREVPREAAAVAYRIVVEALTNVRRHAAQASTVDVTVALDGRDLRVTVADDGAGDNRRDTGRAHAGLGLPGLTERVEALRGALTAGPREQRGWLLSARIPLDGT